MLRNDIMFGKEELVPSGQEETTELTRPSALARASQKLRYTSDTPTWSPT